MAQVYPYADRLRSRIAIRRFITFPISHVVDLSATPPNPSWRDFVDLKKFGINSSPHRGQERK